MPKKKLKKILPTHQKIQEHKFLKIFGKLLYKKELWSLTRKKVTLGVFIGIFVACLPIPFQMVLSTLLAIIFNANLPISFFLIFISNPLTMPPLFYFEYQLGKFIFQSSSTVEFSFDSMYENFDKIALYLWTGAITLGVFSAFISMYIVNLIWIRSIRKNRKNRNY